MVKSPLRLVGHLNFGDQPALRWIPPGELDACSLANQTAAAIATDEVLRAERPTVRERNVNAGAVLRETGYLTSAIDGHRQFADPVGQDAFNVLLAQCETVVMPGGEVADVQRD